MSSYLFRRVVLVDPRSPFHMQEKDVVVEASTLTRIGNPGSVAPQDDWTVVEAERLHLSPGWVDMQAHLADPGYEYKESLSELAKAASQGGFTHVLAYPNTLPPVSDAHRLRALTHRAAGLPANIWFTGTITEEGDGKELAEMYDMHQAGALAFTDGNHPVQSTGIMYRALQYVRSFDGLLIQAPWDASLAKGGQMNEGPLSTSLGMRGIPEMVEKIGANKEIEVHGYHGGRIHFQPLSSPTAIERLDEAKARQAGISIGTPLIYCIQDEAVLEEFDSLYKLMPPLRSSEQVKKMQSLLQKGAIEVLSTGHEPQGIEEKKLEFSQAEPGMLGLQTAFALAMEHLIQPGLIDLGKWVELVSINPRRILNQPELTLAEGQAAAFSLFQPAKRWVFKAQSVPSRAKNSPFLGKEFTGFPFGTFIHGRLFQNA
ncbi:MAG: dihydroorotase [Bacteroidota bacterium]